MNPQSPDGAGKTDDTGVTRREALRADGALLAGLSGAGAGCLSILPPAGQRIRYGRVDVPAPTTQEPVYRRWMPAASAFPDLDRAGSVEDTSWVYAATGNLETEQLGAEFKIATELAQVGLSYFGTDLRAPDRVVGLRSLGTVLIQARILRLPQQDYVLLLVRPLQFTGLVAIAYSPVTDE